MSGVPAVIAMREPISDEAALAFSRVLDDRLAAGDPVEPALAEALLGDPPLTGGSRSVVDTGALPPRTGRPPLCLHNSSHAVPW